MTEAEPTAKTENARTANAPLPVQDVDAIFGLLARMTQEFARGLDLDASLAKGLQTIVDHVGAEVGSLWLLDEAKENVVCQASIGPDPIAGLSLPVTQGIVGRCVREQASQYVVDVEESPDFSRVMDDESGFRTKSLLCAPMSVFGTAVGAVELVNKRGGDGSFEEHDVQVLEVLAATAGLAITNSRMAALMEEQRRVMRELALAADIQRSLLPESRPHPFPIYGVNVPARTVSGDFFDIVPLDDGRIAFCLGDVSGKGINAALLMAKTASLYRCLAKTTPSPGQLLRQIDVEICETATRGMFVTMLAGLYEPETGHCTIANAGHEPPIHQRADGVIKAYPPASPPIGIGLDLTGPGGYPEEHFDLEGGALYVCTDGLTEARHESGEMLGADGLERMIAGHDLRPLGEEIDSIIAAVSRLDLRDDLTLLAVRDRR